MKRKIQFIDEKWETECLERSMERLKEISKSKILARAKKGQKMNTDPETVEYLREKSAKECGLKENELEVKESITGGKRTAT